jgi:hypothetical protein
MRMRSVLALLVAFALVAPVVGDESKRPEKVEKGKLAPALSGLGSWINTKDEIKIENLTGKVVILDFWGVW